MLINPQLDFMRYLDTLAADGMNYTRVFTGAYVEKHGAFGIKRNTLAPLPGTFLAPWKRSDQPGNGGGGNRFDLEQWDEAYFKRLHSFVAEAGKRGVVVEITFFSSIYNDEQWSVNPFNPTNNINGLNETDRKKLQALPVDAKLLGYQERYVRKIVGELKNYDNVFYEIQNEPWADHHIMGPYMNEYLDKQHSFPNAVEIPQQSAVAWQSRVANWIQQEESGLKEKHLIAQNIANFKLSVKPEDIAPGVSILNFHYAHPEAVQWNRGLGKLIGFDETGFAGRSDEVYRRQAWRFMMAGGGLFNHLDYSFTQGKEDGTDLEPNGPGGGSPALRKQLRALSTFLHSFNLAELKPDHTFLASSPGAECQVLSWPGKEYAVYGQGRLPVLLNIGKLPSGRYHAEWIHPVSGDAVARFEFRAGAGAAGPLSFGTPPGLTNEFALRLFSAR
jgi:hypothetical protein